MSNAITIHFDSCDSRSHERAGKQFNDMHLAAIEHFSKIGAAVENIDAEKTYCIRISKKDARGLVASAKAFCRKSCYFEIIGD